MQVFVEEFNSIRSSGAVSKLSSFQILRINDTRMTRTVPCEDNLHFNGHNLSSRKSRQPKAMQLNHLILPHNGRSMICQVIHETVVLRRYPLHQTQRRSRKQLRAVLTPQSLYLHLRNLDMKARTPSSLKSVWRIQLGKYYLQLSRSTA